MKLKLFFFIILLPALLWCTDIDFNKAKEIASFHLKLKAKDQSYKIANSSVLSDKAGRAIAFIINLSPKGFIVIPANDNLIPVLAYSFNSDFINNDFTRNTFYQMLKKDIELREKAFSENSLPNIISNKETRRRYDLHDQIYFKNLEFRQWPYYSYSRMGGWIRTKWHQGNPYNVFCPIDPNTQQRSLLGSVAVAMAQLINYHHYYKYKEFTASDTYVTSTDIRIDNDYKKYDFPNFPNLNKYLKEISNKFDNDADLTSQEVAALCFSLGISVNNHFNSNSTDTWSWDITYAFRNRYNYDKVQMIYSDNDHFWEEIQKNIKSKMPVMLGISANYDYFAICDGYNNSEEYHFNFGWKGNDNNVSECWYYIPSELHSDYSVVSQSIINIGEKVSKRLSETSKKITLDTQNNASIDLLDDEIQSGQDKIEEHTIKNRINEALEDDNLPKFGLTPKFVVYEDPPVLIKKVAPEFSNHNKKSGIQGKVVLEVEVLKNGKVGNIEIIKSLMPGKGGLDEAAIKAVKKWEFIPAKNGGKKVACWVRFPITFELND